MHNFRWRKKISSTLGTVGAVGYGAAKYSSVKAWLKDQGRWADLIDIANFMLNYYIPHVIFGLFICEEVWGICEHAICEMVRAHLFDCSMSMFSTFFEFGRVCIPVSLAMLLS